MIITCPACEKKFSVDQKMIPENGRLVKCGSCGHTWFFEIENKLIKDIDDNTEMNVISEEKIEIGLEKDAPFNSLNKDNAKTNKNINFKKIFNILIVGFITFIAVILLLDTFKYNIKFLIPGIDFYLDNLYQSLTDIKLFMIDLVI